MPAGRPPFLETNLASRWEGVGLPELLESPGLPPEVPRTSPEVPRRLPGRSLTNLTAIQIPRKLPRLPRRSAVSLGSLTPSRDSQELSLTFVPSRVPGTPGHGPEDFLKLVCLFLSRRMPRDHPVELCFGWSSGDLGRFTRSYTTLGCEHNLGGCSSLGRGLEKRDDSKEGMCFNFSRNEDRIDPHGAPPPTPEFLSKDLCLQPGLERKFLPRRTCCRGQDCSHCSFQDFSCLAKGNQVSLMRIHFSHPE